MRRSAMRPRPAPPSRAARSAFDRGPGPNLSMAERASIMSRMHAALVARRGQIRKLIVAEVGCAQGITNAMQVDAPIGHFASALAHSASDDRRYLPLEATQNPMNPAGPRILGSGSVVREPVGVIAGITGYNFPFLLNLAKIVPALLAGNTLVLKPSPFTPYSALLFGEVAEEIGLPKGVLNIVTGGVEVGSLLSAHPHVDMVSFTGSEPVGIAIMQQAAATLKRVHLELGGKSALIVRADADLEQAALRADRRTRHQLRSRLRAADTVLGAQFRARAIRRDCKNRRQSVENRRSGRSVRAHGTADP